MISGIVLKLKTYRVQFKLVSVVRARISYLRSVVTDRENFNKPEKTRHPSKPLKFDKNINYQLLLSSAANMSMSAELKQNV